MTDMLCLVCGIWPPVAGGWRCQACSKYLKKHGVERPEVLIARDRAHAHAYADSVWARIGKSVERQKNGCWQWTGGKVNGTPVVSVKGRATPVAKLLYQGIHGQIKAKDKVVTSCFNRTCVAPYHQVLAKP